MQIFKILHLLWGWSLVETCMKALFIIRQGNDPACYLVRNRHTDVQDSRSYVIIWELSSFLYLVFRTGYWMLWKIVSQLVICSELQWLYWISSKGSWLLAKVHLSFLWRKMYKIFCLGVCFVLFCCSWELSFPTGDSDASVTSPVTIVISSASPEKPPRSGQGFVFVFFVFLFFFPPFFSPD